jgi:hypothetical protein
MIPMYIFTLDSDVTLTADKSETQEHLDGTII